MLARLDHVRVAAQGVVARALIAERNLGLGEEPRPRLGPEPGEGGRPFGQRQRPELVGRQVDIVRTGNRHDPAPFPSLSFNLISTHNSGCMVYSLIYLVNA